MANATIEVQLFDGTRKRLGLDTDVLLTIRPQFRPKPVYADFFRGYAKRIPVRAPDDGTGYVIVASARGYEQSGLGPVMVEADKTLIVHLMLLGNDAGFNFSASRWDQLQNHPSLFSLLIGKDDPSVVYAKYTELTETQPDSLACFLNIAAAFSQLPLNNPTAGILKPLDYLKSVEWGAGFRQDRFFGFAAETLLEDIGKTASNSRKNPADRIFEKAPKGMHPGASSSYKQIEFREANLQVTFHAKVFDDLTREPLIKVELDMDYYRDKAAHALLEVIPNTLSFGRRLTDPRQVYMMRWMAGKDKGSNFDPLFTVSR
jgi:hypothetical protein